MGFSQLTHLVFPHLTYLIYSLRHRVLTRWWRSTFGIILLLDRVLTRWQRYTEEISIVLIPLAGRNNIELHNVALVVRCDSNLILLGKFYESGNTYHDNLKAVILIGNGEVIVWAKRDQNLFILDFTQLGKAMIVISKKTMAITRHGQPTYLVC